MSDQLTHGRKPPVDFSDPVAVAQARVDAKAAESDWIQPTIDRLNDQIAGLQARVDNLTELQTQKAQELTDLQTSLGVQATKVEG